MIAEEWNAIFTSMVGRWPQVDWSSWERSRAIGQYLSDLEDLPGEHVALAVDALARDGRDWPPPAGLIRQTVIELAMDAPEWGEVCRDLIRCLSLSTNRFQGGEWHDDRAAAVEELHPLVRAFVARIGWREAAHAGSDDRAAEAQVREKWLAFVRRVGRDQALVGLPAGGLRALERVNGQGPRQIADVIGRALPAATATPGGDSPK